MQSPHPDQVRVGVCRLISRVAARHLGIIWVCRKLRGHVWTNLELGALRIRQARVDVNGRDTIVGTKTDRNARDLPLPPRELAMLKAMRSVHLRERLALGQPLADNDLLLSRVDGTWLPVRDYSREFAAQRAAAGLKAITLGELRHSNISRMRTADVAADVVAAWHGHTERMTQAVYGRVTDERLTAAAGAFCSAVGQSEDNRPSVRRLTAKDPRPVVWGFPCGVKGTRTPDPHMPEARRTRDQPL